MFSRWYTVAVVCFWLATAGWLLKQKILPPLLVGDPPSYRTIIDAQSPIEAPVAWRIFLNGNPLGEAMSRLDSPGDGITEINSSVRLDRLPLAELTPVWLSSFIKLIGNDRERSGMIIAVQATGRTQIDPLGRPISFYSTTKIGAPESELDGQEGTEGLYMRITMKGTVEGDMMRIVVQCGDFVYRTQIPLPPNSLMGDVLSPPTRLPDLRVGQSWTVPTYSPFHPPNEPLEILHATVEGKDPIVWNGDVVPAFVVSYHGDPGRGLSSNQGSRARIWVDYRGQVIKQELSLLSSRLTFIREDDDAAAASELKFEPLQDPNPGADLDAPTTPEDATGQMPPSVQIDPAAEPGAPQGSP